MVECRKFLNSNAICVASYSRTLLEIPATFGFVVTSIHISDLFRQVIKPLLSSTGSGFHSDSVLLVGFFFPPKSWTHACPQCLPKALFFYSSFFMSDSKAKSSSSKTVRSKPLFFYMKSNYEQHIHNRSLVVIHWHCNSDSTFVLPLARFFSLSELERLLSNVFHQGLCISWLNLLACINEFD